MKKIKTTATFTATLLARELNLTTRRIRQLEQEGVFRRLPNNKFDPEECAAAYTAFKAGRGSAALARVYDDAGRLADCIDRDLAAISKLPLDKRMVAATADDGVGARVGRLIHLLSLIAACAPDGPQREFERQHVAMLQSQILGSMLSTIRVELEPGAAA